MPILDPRVAAGAYRGAIEHLGHRRESSSDGQAAAGPEGPFTHSPGPPDPRFLKNQDLQPPRPR